MKVSIVAAVTADGFIAQSSDQLADWTSKEDKQLFVQLTKQAGVMIMGSTTFDTIGRPLPERKTVVYTSQPEKYTNVAVTATSSDPAEVLAELASEGFTEVTICGGAHVYDLFIKSGLVTDIYLTVEPFLFGSGVPLFKTAALAKLTLVSSEALGNSGAVANHYVISKTIEFDTA